MDAAALKIEVLTGIELNTRPTAVIDLSVTNVKSGARLGENPGDAAAESEMTTPSQ